MQAESVPTTEFYVPATFQYSMDSGRIERILVGLFDEDGEIEVRHVIADEPIPEFYVPAMFQFSTAPGRIERFLQALFEGGDDEELQEFPVEFRDDFYLPAVDPDEFRRSTEQERGPLIPASELNVENGDPDEPGT